MKQNEMGTDPQVRRAEVERTLELFRTVAKQRKGRIVFLTGPAGAGHTETVMSVLEELGYEKPKPTLVAGSFTHGQYEPLDLKTRAPWKKALALAKEIIPIADTSGLTLFAANLVGASIAAWELGERLSTRQVVDSHPVKLLLRACAQEGPTICALDHFEQADASWRSELVLTFAPEIAAELPLLLIMSINGPTQLGTFARDQQDLLYVARRLVQRGLAEWRPLRPLTEVEIAEWIGPADSGLTKQIHSVTGGNPHWVKLLWNDFQERRVVVQDSQDGAWHFVDGERSLGLVNDVLSRRLRYLLQSDDASQFDKTLAVLSCAALEGSKFTVAAVARAMSLDLDELTDFFDDFLVKDDAAYGGVLVEAGKVEVKDPRTGPRHLWLYAFSSDLYHLTLLRYGLTHDERIKTSESLARALRDLYSPEEYRVADVLGRLFKASGDLERATYYQRMADFGVSALAARRQAQFQMLSATVEYRESDYFRGAALLLESGRRMMEVFPYPEVLRVFESAYEMAKRSGVRADQAIALYYRGMCQSHLGELPAASDSIEEARVLYSQLGDRRGEALSWNLAADVARQAGDFDAACDRLYEALKIFLEVEDRERQANVLHQFGVIESRLGNFPDARESFQKAFLLCKELGDQRGSAAALAGVAVIDFELGDFQSAKKLLVGVLKINRMIGNRYGEGANQYWLGRIERRLRNFRDAHDLLLQSLALDQELGNRTDEPLLWEELGLLASDVARPLMGLRLRTLGYILEKTMNPATVTRWARSLQEMAVSLNLRPEETDAILKEVEAAYERDKGSDLLASAFE